MRWLILFGVIAASMWLGWRFLDDYMTLQGWATATPEFDEKGAVIKYNWLIVGAGWEVLKYSWPSALAGALAAAVVIVPVLGFISKQAAKIDSEHEIGRLRAQVASERDNANQAMAKAKNELQRDIERLRAFEEAILARETSVENQSRRIEEHQAELEQWASSKVMEAEHRTAVALQRAENAEKDAHKSKVKMQRASGGYARLKAKAKDA